MPASPRYQAFLEACFDDLSHAARMLDEDPTLLSARSGLGETPLHYLAVENAVEAVRFLLSRGADADPRNDFGNSPLQECVSICKAERDLTAIIDLLLRAGADPYHSAATSACAWHAGRGSDHPALKALFDHLPQPAGRHEDCEMFTPDPDEPNDQD